MRQEELDTRHEDEVFRAIAQGYAIVRDRPRSTVVRRKDGISAFAHAFHLLATLAVGAAATSGAGYLGGLIGMGIWIAVWAIHANTGGSIKVFELKTYDSGRTAWLPVKGGASRTTTPPPTRPTTPRPQVPIYREDGAGGFVRVDSAEAPRVITRNDDAPPDPNSGLGIAIALIVGAAVLIGIIYVATA